ncbi:hypothetical protein [Massilia sp.]|uniref:hypothetical protein n=1 Tax=Massilia sp. TaxID=1882437 RepID=UPI0028AF7674|nr:hypothetical protein [Massilia sp.]
MLPDLLYLAKLQSNTESCDANAYPAAGLFYSPLAMLGVYLARRRARRGFDD